jgi:hypothetical protein
MEKIIKCDCYECGKETNQNILYSYIKEKKPSIKKGKTEIDKSEYYVVECRGCNYVSFLLKEVTYIDGKEDFSINESFPDDITDDLDEDDDENFLREEEINILPPLVRSIYEEVEEAFQTDIPILTGIGLRTLLEAICVNEKIPGRNLQEKIENLYKKDYVAKKSLPILHDLRLIGNVTAHQMKKPTERTLDYSLEILHHTLKGLYITPYLHAKLKK